MSEENELYTDYALQIFSSFINQDIETMSAILESFKDEGKSIDHLFMPGVIYGLMYHMQMLLELFSVHTTVPVEKLLSSYAMDYAVAREDLLDNKILNVAKAKEGVEKLLEELKNIEDLFGEES